MNRAKEIVLSSLGHTWILDLDGTLVKHNGYKIDGADIPYGERIVINDCKPGGLITSIAINMERDQGEFMKPVINRQL